MIALQDDIRVKDTKSSTAKAAGVWQRVHLSIKAKWLSYQLRRAEKVAIHQLMQLDEYLLKDMGLCREDLEVALRNKQLLDEVYRNNQNC